MTQLRYVPDANDAYSLEATLKQNIGFTFNPIAIEGLLSRWKMYEITSAIQIVFNAKTMGCDALLYAVETYLEKEKP